MIYCSCRNSVYTNADVFTYHTSFNIPARQTNPMQPHDLSFHPYLHAVPRHHGRRYGVDGGAGNDGGGGRGCKYGGRGGNSI